MEKKSGWRWGFKRWLVLLFIILGYFAARWFAPVLPNVRLPSEVIGTVFGLPIYNTFTAMLIADVIIIVIALIVRRATSSGNLVPSGLSGAVEALLEAIYNLTASTAGRWARAIFPFFATITLYVLIVNWMELIPFVDSVGIIEHAEAANGHAIQTLAPGIVSLVKGAGNYVLVPYVRVLSTDLNFTVALALIAVFMTQVIGIRALGMNYFRKFWNTETLFSKPIFGVIDFGVGILEVVSEFSKILSFSFRLFGNLFAGTVLLFVIGSLVPVFAQSIFLGLEFFVGLIQALVFGMLTMVFMSQATQGHFDEHEAEEPSGEEMPIDEPQMI